MGRKIGTLIDNYSHEQTTYREGQEDKFAQDYADMLYCMGVNGATYKVHGHNPELAQKLREVLLNEMGIDLTEVC